MQFLSFWETVQYHNKQCIIISRIVIMKALANKKIRLG